MENLKGIFTVKLEPDMDGAEKIINNISEGKLLPEVVDNIKKYSLGNYGVATVLTKIALRDNYTEAIQVETLVGWPLWSHSLKKAEKIWDRFKNDV